jgi:hypothetical protein
MTDLTDLCAAALVATQHAFDEQDDVGLWIAARDAWAYAEAESIAKAASGPMSYMAHSLVSACKDARSACYSASWYFDAAEKGPDDIFAQALIAAEVVMMWLD